MVGCVGPSVLDMDFIASKYCYHVDIGICNIISSIFLTTCAAIEPGLLVYKNGTVVDWSCCDDAGNSKDLSVFVDGEEVQYRKASSGMLLNGTCFGGNITIFPSPNGNCFMELKCRSIESYTSKSLEIGKE